MSSPKRSFSCFLPFLLLLLILLVAPINGKTASRKLDETGLPDSPDPSIKCGGCSPCGSAHCYLSPPPPPPQLPPPPPPPKKKPTPGYNCPPPPSEPGFIYMNGPPGELYPVDPSYSGSGRTFGAPLPAFLGCGFLGLLIMLWL